MNNKIAIIGLGYVGLPLALAFAKKFPNVVGFDTNRMKIKSLKEGTDITGETSSEDLKTTSLQISSDLEVLKDRDIFIIAVPTPIDDAHRPDLSILIKATETVGHVLKHGAIVCYESTVYPGATEEICGPVLENISGLKQGIDFTLGYSPERINPGDKIHRLESITKIVSGENKETLEVLTKIYGKIIEAGIYKATSIKVAEAAKVIENTQRDLNIALMNELSLIFDRMELRTADVLEAAGTKWNFLKFYPGLVGGHCIGVDPYYLTHKAESMGYIPEVILAGRRINDGMGKFIAEKTIKLLCSCNKRISKAKIGILGLTFKENVPDLRNSRIPDIVSELKSYGVTPLIHDPLCDPLEAVEEYGITLSSEQDLYNLDALIFAVPHDIYLSKSPQDYIDRLKSDNAVLVDIKSKLKECNFPNQIKYWSL